VVITLKQRHTKKRKDEWTQVPVNKPGFDKVLLKNNEFSLETSFCSSLLYFEMIVDNKKQRILELRKDALVHHVTIGILTNPTT